MTTVDDNNISEFTKNRLEDMKKFNEEGFEGLSKKRIIKKMPLSLFGKEVV